MARRLAHNQPSGNAQRMSKITKSARGKSCTLRVSGYGGCSDPETTVFCHAPCRDKGRGFKSPDWWGAYGCQNCHDFIDSRAKIADVVANWPDRAKPVLSSRYLTADEKNEAWLRGIYETQKILFTEGLLHEAG